MLWDNTVIEILVFAGVGGLVLTILLLVNRHDRRLEERGEELWQERPRGGMNVPIGDGGFSRLFDSAGPKFISHLLPDDPDERTRLQSRLLQAGLYRKVDVFRFLGARLLLMVAPLVVCLACGSFGGLTMQRAFVGGAVLGAVGMILPGLWLDRRKAKRQMVLGRSLPDFLDLMVTCLESGLSLDGALRRVTVELRHAHAVLAGEMERVQNEIDLGATADAAIHHLADRSDMESIRTLGTFLQQSRKLGTSIAEAIRAHAEMLRVQRELPEELAQKAAVKILFPTLLFIFPSVFVVLAGPAAIQLNEKFTKAPTEAPANPNP